jgi:DNA modification methylase
LELEDLKNLNFDLDLTGFDLSEVERLLRDDEIEEDDYDAMPADKDAPVVSKLGDLWILGEHRLLCGDSTKIDDVKKLMNGKIADMVFCDPPYNVRINNIIGLGSVHHDEFQMASGEMTGQEFIDFLSLVFKNLVTVSKDGSIHYQCMDWKHIYEIMVAGRAAYTELKQLCVWNKDNGGMGSFYRSKHELIFVFKNGTAKHTNNFELGQHNRYRTNVWDYAGMNSFTNQTRARTENGEVSIGSEELKMHPTVKPVKLVADAILDCSLFSHRNGGKFRHLFCTGRLQRNGQYSWLAFVCKTMPEKIRSRDRSSHPEQSAANVSASGSFGEGSGRLMFIKLERVFDDVFEHLGVEVIFKPRSSEVDKMRLCDPNMEESM